MEQGIIFTMKYTGQQIEQQSVVNKSDQYNGAGKLKKRDEFLICGNQVVIIVQGKIKEDDEVDQSVQSPETAAGFGFGFWF